MKNLLKPQHGWIVLAIVIAWQLVSAFFFVSGPYSTINQMGLGPMPEERFGYEPDELTSWLDELGEAGRATYQRFQLLDVINAAVAAFALTNGLSFTLSRLFSAEHYIHTFRQLPIFVFLLELFENLLLYLNGGNFPDVSGVSILSTATMVKLVFGFGTMIFFVITAIWVFVKYLQNRNA